MASEVIEHVSNVPEFCASLVALTKPGGSLVISTINRTYRSYAVAIIGAEQIMGLLPKGTHQWERFITPGKRSGFLTMQRAVQWGASLAQTCGRHGQNNL